MNRNDQPAAPAPQPGIKLNHLHLCTSQVAALSSVFTRHFAFNLEQGNDDFALLRGSDGFFLVLMKISPDSPPTYPFSSPFNFHVGFMLDAPAQVHAKHQELQDAGHQPGPVKSFEAMGASWTAFYCPVGDGIDIEVNAHIPLSTTAD